MGALEFDEDQMFHGLLKYCKLGNEEHGNSFAEKALHPGGYFHMISESKKHKPDIETLGRQGDLLEVISFYLFQIVN